MEVTSREQLRFSDRFEEKFVTSRKRRCEIDNGACVDARAQRPRAGRSGRLGHKAIHRGSGTGNRRRDRGNDSSRHAVDEEVRIEPGKSSKDLLYDDCRGRRQGAGTLQRADYLA